MKTLEKNGHKKRLLNKQSKSKYQQPNYTTRGGSEPPPLLHISCVEKTAHNVDTTCATTFKRTTSKFRRKPLAEDLISDEWFVKGVDQL